MDVSPAGSTHLVDRADLARRLYAALAAGDREALDALLDPAFEGRLAEGMPLGIGGARHGAAAMRRDGWGAIARHFIARAEPEQIVELTDGRLLVTGRYTGEGRGGGPLDAAFAHVLTIADGRITALEQYTDTARWAAAAPPESPAVTESRDGGLVTIRFERPDHHNAIDLRFTRDLAEITARLADDPSVRTVLLTGAGPTFNVGGDIELFGRTEPGEFPALLREMIDDYHLALGRLAALDAPVVAAVRGAAAGGGLGLVCIADIALATPGTTFALGYAALGLVADGGNSWHLPRLVGMRRAQEMFLLNRRVTADEAVEWGLVTRLVPDDELDAEALAVAGRLATGPTRALGAMRRLLSRSLSVELGDQLDAEKTAIIAAAGSADAAEGITAFAARRRPRFTGGSR